MRRGDSRDEGRDDLGGCASPLLALAGLLLAADASAWWNTTWSHRRKLTLDNQPRARAHADFPVLIVLDN